MKGIVAGAQIARGRHRLFEPVIGIRPDARVFRVELRLELRVEDVDGMHLYVALGRRERACKAGIVLRKGGEKDLGIGNIPRTE